MWYIWTLCKELVRVLWVAELFVKLYIAALGFKLIHYDVWWWWFTDSTRILFMYCPWVYVKFCIYRLRYMFSDKLNHHWAVDITSSQHSCCSWLLESLHFKMHDVHRTETCDVSPLCKAAVFAQRVEMGGESKNKELSCCLPRKERSLQ